MNNCINFKNGCTGKSIKYNGYCFACCACGNMYCKNNIEFGHKLCKVHECVIFGCLNRNKKDICLEHIICVITNEFGKFCDHYYCSLESFKSKCTENSDRCWKHRCYILNEDGKLCKNNTLDKCIKAKHIKWSPDNHIYFPDDIKSNIMQLLLILKRNQDKIKVLRFVIYEIIKCVV